MCVNVYIIYLYVYYTLDRSNDGCAVATHLVETVTDGHPTIKWLRINADFRCIQLFSFLRMSYSCCYCLCSKTPE